MEPVYLQTHLTFHCDDDDAPRFAKDIFNDGEYADACQTKVVLDIGAHIGLFSAFVHSSAQIIYAIEPNPINFQRLLENIQQNSLTRVKPFNCAIWKTTGMEKMTRRSSGGGALGGGELDVQACTLSDFVADNGIERIDLIKCDTEGAEGAIFMEPHAKYILSHVPNIVMEHCTGEVMTLLTQLGFTSHIRGGITYFKK